MESPDFDAQLGAAFNFTQADLEANESGYLSAKQRHWARNQYLERLTWAWGGTIGGTCIIAGLIASSVANKAAPPVCLLAISLPLLVGWAFISSYRDSRRQLLTKVKVVTLTGPIRLVYNAGSIGPKYRLHLQRYEFYLSEKQARSLYEGHLYRVHKLPFDDQILSLVATPPADLSSVNQLFKDYFGRSISDMTAEYPYPIRWVIRPSLELLSTFLVLLTIIGYTLIDTGDTTLFAVISAAAMIPLVYILYCFYLAIMDIRSGQIAIVKGRAEIQTKKHSLFGALAVKLGGHAFSISQRLFFLFRHGQHYRVTYSPRSRIILAAELLPPEDK